jgi:hypothetical protein
MEAQRRLNVMSKVAKQSMAIFTPNLLELAGETYNALSAVFFSPGDEPCSSLLETPRLLSLSLHSLASTKMFLFL